MKTMMMVLLAFGSLSFAGEENNLSSGLTLTGPALAAHGFDVVAYFEQHRAVRGSYKFAAKHQDATYRFTSKENLELFKKNPARYVPQFGGYCAFGASVGAKFDGDPEYWRIVDGKLYFNLNGDIQQKWLENLQANIKKANKKWPSIAAKAASSL